MVSITGYRDLSITAANAGIRRRLDSVTHGLALFVRGVCALNLVLLSLSPKSFADESHAPPPASVSQLEETNSGEALQVLLQIDEQLRSNRLAIEQNGQEARETALRNAEMLSNGWQMIKTSFSAQQVASSARTARELEAMQSSNQVMLFGAAAFAVCFALTMLILAYFQWRMSKAFAGFLTVLPVSPGPACGPTVPVLSSGEPKLSPVGPIEDSNRRLPGMIEQRERRIQGLQHNSLSALKPHDTLSSSANNGDLITTSRSAPASASADQSTSDENDRISALLAKGQSMLKDNELEIALECFEEVLSGNPNHGGALVKKGMALEGLKKLHEAFEYYNRAIAADASLTIAYLRKGGLCNRLERFKEALDCYEQALQTHHD